MSATALTFGFIPQMHPTGKARANLFTIATGYAANLFKYAPVTLDANGTITAGATNADLIGVFAGCEYVDANGVPTMSPYWPTGTAATNIKAYVWTDPNIVYTVCANGSIAQTAIGDQADLVNPTTGSTATGLSASTLNSSLAGASSQGQFRIIGFDASPNNAVGDAYTVVQVQLARSEFVSNKVAV